MAGDGQPVPNGCEPFEINGVTIHLDPLALVPELHALESQLLPKGQDAYWSGLVEFLAKRHGIRVTAGQAAGSAAQPQTPVSR